MSILRLAIPTPLRQLFDYLPPAGTNIDELQAGTRLQVPFGSRQVTGYLVEVTQQTDQDNTRLKTAQAVLDADSLLNANTIALCEWAARYYHHPPGEVFAAAFPPRLRQGKDQLDTGTRGWQLSIQGKGLPADALSRAPKQAAALNLLQAQSQASQEALSTAGASTSVLRALRDKGLIEEVRLQAVHRPPVAKPGLTLNEEQATALSGLEAALGSFSCHLLEGVTGSGKTEVYLQLIAQCLAAGQQALVLIPEIGLTPQTLERFEQRFDAHIAVFHSGLTELQRYQAWEAARDGRAAIIIGTRSAVFTPLHNAGVIIVDEEHDGSYKQQDGFRYSARDVAVKRAQLEGCPVLLGSATPSLESLHNALQGRYQHPQLSARAGSGTLPTIGTEDVRGQPLQAGLSATLINAAKSALGRSEQVLLFLNRRGYAASVLCHDCGWMAECSACDARLTVHRRQRQLRCHHCNARRPLPDQCPECRGNRLLTQGLGTEQTEDTLMSLFPGTPIHRVDSDSIQGRDAMGALVARINSAEPCILLGTQMLTKGHHFPNVSLIGIIDADALLFSADFRGEERMAQLLTQVAGRAGRAETGGQVIMQTHYPDHPAVLAMIEKPFADQARAMLATRQASGMPPYGQLLMVRTDCSDQATGERFLQQLRRLSESALPNGCHVVGPLPSAMPRRAGKFRNQLMVMGGKRSALQRCASMLVQHSGGLRATGDLKWTIVVDPQDVM